MYRYKCLNPISEVGLKRFSGEYQQTQELAEADAVLVRSANMHDMELPAQGPESTIFRSTGVPRRESLSSIRRAPIPTASRSLFLPVC